MLQTPPAKACSFDLFVWTPEETRAQLGDDAPCGGGLGVEAGSNALDGRGGATGCAVWAGYPLRLLPTNNGRRLCLADIAWHVESCRSARDRYDSTLHPCLCRKGSYYYYCYCF